MLRALFVLEFRRALVPAVIIAIAVAAVVASIENIVVARAHADPDTAAQASLLLLLAGIALSGLFAGARVFSREFKERHYPLLTTLPVSPGLTWLVLTSAGLSASVVGIAAVVLTHPRLVADVEWAGVLGLASATHLFLFAIGSCLALACRRALFVLVLGFPIAAAILFETLSFDRALGSIPIVPRPLSAGAAATLVLFVVSSLVLFIRGEFDLPKVRFRTHLSLWSVLISMVMLVRWVHPTPLLPLPDKSALGRSLLGRQMSPDGRFFAWVQRQLDGRIRISFASGESGNPSGRWSGADISAVAWAPDEDALWVALRPEPWSRIAGLLGRSSSDLVRIGSDGRELSRNALPSGEVEEILPLPDRRILASVSDPIVSRVVLVAASRRPFTVEVAGASEVVRFASASQGRAVVWIPLSRKPKAWLCTPGGIEPFTALDVVSRAGEFAYWPPIVIGRRAFFSDTSVEAAQKELLRLYARPPGVTAGHYVFAGPVADDPARVFHVAFEPGNSVRVDVWDRGSSRWREVARDIACRVKPIDGTRSGPGVQPDTNGIISGEDWYSFVRSATGIDFDAELGLAVYDRVRDGAFQAFLYDDALARDFPLGRAMTEPRRLLLQRVTTSTLRVVFPNSTTDSVEAFGYDLGSGAPQVVPSAPKDVAQRTRCIRADGTRILETSGGELAIRLADGTERPIRFH